MTFFNSLFLARQSWHHFLWPLLCMESCDEILAPTLGLLCESQVCNIGVSFGLCSITKGITMFSWCSSHVLLHHMPLVLLNLNKKWLATKNTRRCIPTWKHVIAFVNKKVVFYGNLFLWLYIYIYSHDNSGYLPTMLCLWSQTRPWELHLAAINGGIVPSFTSKHLALLFKLQG